MIRGMDPCKAENKVVLVWCPHCRRYTWCRTRCLALGAVYFCQANDEHGLFSRDQSIADRRARYKAKRRAMRHPRRRLHKKHVSNSGGD